MTGPSAVAATGRRFGDRVTDHVAARESQIVLGLDPDPSRLWPGSGDGVPADGPPAARAAAAVAAHCRAVIAAVAPAVVAVKPQLACFERLGAPGRAALGAAVEAAHEHGLLVVADGKRGDIDVSATAYAQSLVGTTPTPYGDVPGLGADALTAAPYMGVDTIDSLLAVTRPAGAGVFVLVRTSNPGAADVEDLELAGGGPLWEHVARIVDRLGEGDGAALHDVGAVVGATRPEHVARMRELMPRAVFLLPGVGAQGGRVEDLAPAWAPGPAGGLATASRSIVQAAERGGVGTPAAAARAEAERLRDAAWSLA
ncbi:orotidine-5'-phosphate decarboxylase [Paraconexibacter algicola]|uniref:Orotidine-5'-phosphate decarboxylase n=1 Tax=Paraconexibacter algicola TaxID=2133960 RepID=A0A2T4UF28_9ACTN|nr:orotidine-5'-phosphate decarboxylase [Paraconexibacter algicola]PTL56375.1 orotidine-5'-phosphate decarboxylase [Paraconexibacter algicola]